MQLYSEQKCKNARNGCYSQRVAAAGQRVEGGVLALQLMAGRLLLRGDLQLVPQHLPRQHREHRRHQPGTQRELLTINR